MVRINPCLLKSILFSISLNRFLLCGYDFALRHMSTCLSLPSLSLSLILDEFKSFLKRLPATHFLPVSSVHLLWGSDWDLQNRYRLLQSSLEAQRLKIQRTARKLFGLSIRCHHNPNHQMPRERWELMFFYRIIQQETWIVFQELLIIELNGTLLKIYVPKGEMKNILVPKITFKWRVLKRAVIF